MALSADRSILARKYSRRGGGGPGILRVPRQGTRARAAGGRRGEREREAARGGTVLTTKYNSRAAASAWGDLRREHRSGRRPQDTPFGVPAAGALSLAPLSRRRAGYPHRRLPFPLPPMYLRPARLRPRLARSRPARPPASPAARALLNICLSEKRNSIRKMQRRRDGNFAARANVRRSSPGFLSRAGLLGR